MRLQKDERNAVGQRTRVIVDFLHLRFRCQISHDVESWLFKRNLVNVHCPYTNIESLGMPSPKKSAVFFNIVQKAFAPPPLLFEHLSYFAGGIF